MPASPACLIEPIRERLMDLPPARKADHKLGCDRHRIPVGVVFDKLARVSVFGRA